MKSDNWLKELYDANYARLYCVAANRLQLYTGHTEDVQDVLQEVFLEASRKNIRNHPNKTAWLISTTSNICKNYIRADYRQKRKKSKYEQGELWKCQQDPLLFVASEKDQTLLCDIMITLEQILTPDELRLIELYCLNGWKLEELGKEMHMTPNALRVRIFRIRKKIKKYFP